MSSTATSRGSASARPRRREHRWAVEIPLILWLMLVWAVLWGELTAKNLLVGLVLSLLVTRALALPPVQLSSRFNVLHAVTLFVTFLWQVIRASFEVMWTVIAHGPRASSSVTAVQMRSHSDLIMTATGSTTGLIPGSVLLEVDRPNAILYFHVLDVHDDEDIEHFRESVRNTEAAWIRMMGSPEDYAALRREDAQKGRGLNPRAVLRSWAGYAHRSKAERGDEEQSR
ncbi:Na+/H+ antiporter subunit E [Kocuria palustris]|uniref:Na+/H+ antiporter subunit E n=1 Tax=Kocuria palustris TaxID=71999 RepID=UPI0006AA251F|nr:Na+/H+ antiporter subunit E [Kocuria palustris]ALB03840.1 cation:proton antiporter [Kocuria palustris]MCM3331003.1 Na+/H+ antiporter subunit E [Kocuria palustris]